MKLRRLVGVYEHDALARTQIILGLKPTPRPPTADAHKSSVTLNLNLDRLGRPMLGPKPLEVGRVPLLSEGGNVESAPPPPWYREALAY